MPHMYTCRGNPHTQGAHIRKDGINVKALTIEFTQILKPTHIFNSGCYTGSDEFSSIIFLGEKKTRKHK